MFIVFAYTQLDILTLKKYFDKHEHRNSAIRRNKGSIRYIFLRGKEVEHKYNDLLHVC